MGVTEASDLCGVYVEHGPLKKHVIAYLAWKLLVWQVAKSSYYA